MWKFDEPQDGILQVRIDREGKPVNSFSIETMNQLRDVAAFVGARSDIEAVVFISGKPSSFLAGADLYEIRANATFDATLKMSRNGHSAFQAIEELDVITIAAIHGVALGGGLEFAMACDFRIATDDRRTLLGLPEVHLGLMPGWGATVRLPELVGFELATDLLLSGRNLSPKDALDAGLVDEVVAADSLEDAAIRFAKSGPTKRQLAAFNPKDVQQLLDEADATVRQTTGGHYPAPLKMIEVLEAGLEEGEEKKFDLEANGIATLAPDPVTEELIRLFFLKEASKKPPTQEIKEAAKAFELKRVGVIGDCEYGEGIACLFAAAGVKTNLAFIGETNTETATPSYDNLRRTADVHDLGDASVVIEAIIDDLDTERGLFQTLGTVVHPESTIASTSASFLLMEQSEGVPQPERLIGLRFFSPVSQTSMIEIVQKEETTVESLGAAYAIARRLGRHSVMVKDSPGFLVNRLLVPYLTEVGYLLSEVAEPTEVVGVATGFGMQSPLEVTDALGLKAISAITKRMHRELTEHLPPSPLWRAIMDSEDPSLKFLADGQLNPSVLPIIERIKADASASAESETVTIARLIYPIINAGAQCLAERVVDSADAIDLAMVLVGGFPAFRGGPMRYAESVGLPAIVSELRQLARTNSRLAPSDALVRFAEAGSFSA
ncbi:MAG: enoyl-CoA hydratase-related protein [Planctomycetaceae bacterium]